MKSGNHIQIHTGRKNNLDTINLMKINLTEVGLKSQSFQMWGIYFI